MKLSLSLILLAISLNLFAQNISCDSLNSKVIPYKTSMFDEEPEGEIKEDLQLLINCGANIDSVDLLIIQERASALSFKNEKGKRKQTYGDLKKKFGSERSSSDYPEYKKIYYKAHVLKNTPIKLDDWQQIKQTLVELREKENSIARYHQLYIDFDGQQMLFKDLTRIMFFEDRAFGNKKEYKRKEKIVWPNKNLEYSEVLKKATDERKPILLYFTQYGSDQTIKMEEFILSDAEVKTVLDSDFIFVPLYVDDKTPLARSFIGDRNADLQLKLFPLYIFQPQFLILKPDGTKIKEFNYTVAKEEFMDFLKEGQAKANNN